MGDLARANNMSRTHDRSDSSLLPLYSIGLLTSVDSFDRTKNFRYLSIISSRGLRGSRRVLSLGRFFSTLIGRTASGSYFLSFDSGCQLFREGEPAGLSLEIPKIFDRPGKKRKKEKPCHRRD